MGMVFNLMDTLTLREQLKLLELATEAPDMRVRDHALSIIEGYLNPPRMIVSPEAAEKIATLVR